MLYRLNSHHWQRMNKNEMLLECLKMLELNNRTMAQVLRSQIHMKLISHITSAFDLFNSLLLCR